MKPTRHSSNNTLIGAPKNVESLDEGSTIDPLPLTKTKFCGVESNVCFWQPDEEEIASILAGMPIAVTVLGPAFYPLYVGVSDSL